MRFGLDLVEILADGQSVPNADPIMDEARPGKRRTTAGVLRALKGRLSR